MDIGTVFLSKIRGRAVAIATAALLAPEFAFANGIAFQTEGRAGGATSSAEASEVPTVRIEGNTGLLAVEDPATLAIIEVNAPNAGETVRLDNVPFAIELKTPELDREIPGAVPGLIENSIVLRGVLDGEVFAAGEGTSELQATIGLVRPGELEGLGTGKIYDFPIPLEEIETGTAFALDALGDGRFALRAQLTASPVPEPATIAVFAAVAVGLGLRRIAGRRRPG